jgi:hypothetical protein
MAQYTVIISSADNQAETVVSVDSVAGEPRVTQVAVRSREGADIALHPMPDIDLQLLLRALWPSGEPDDAPPTRAAPKRSSGRKPAATTPRTAPANAKTKSKVGTQQPPVRAGRVYRRMPDDLAEVYAEHGTVVAVAKHYGVPRHTAQGWIGRLRASSAGSE